jgi:hypothetical protein
MVQFVDETAWRTAGAPRQIVPDEIAAWMDETYTLGKVCELPAPARADRHDFDRLLKLYAKRCGKTVYIQDFVKDGAAWIRFKMRDKRPYTRSALPREKR